MGTSTIRKVESLAAIFPDERHARMAMRELDELGFKRSWIGIVRSGEEQLIPIVDAADGGGMFEAIGRFFGGEGDRSLHAVLTSHGIPSDRARALAAHVRPQNAVLTVEIEEMLSRAIETIEAHGGDVGRKHGPQDAAQDSAAVFL